MVLRRAMRYRRPPRFRDDGDLRTRARGGPPAGGAGGRNNDGGSRSSSGSYRDDGPEGRAGGRAPIGVPRGYTVTSQRTADSFRGMSANAVENWSAHGAGPGALIERGPRYFDGDEDRPAGQGFDAIIMKQRALVIGGYLGADSEFTFGRWDTTTRNAYMDLLHEANASGLTAEQMLQQAAMGMRSGGGGGGGSGGGGGGGAGGGWSVNPETGEMEFLTETFVPPPLELRTTNQQDLARVMRSAVIDKLGIGWDDAKIRELVSAFNWMEIKLQKDAYDQEVNRMRQEWDAGVSGLGAAPGADTSGITQGTISQLSAPAPETFIEDYMRKNNTAEYQQNEGLELMLPLLEAWGGGGGIA